MWVNSVSADAYKENRAMFRYAFCLLVTYQNTGVLWIKNPKKPYVL